MSVANDAKRLRWAQLRPSSPALFHILIVCTVGGPLARVTATTASLAAGSFDLESALPRIQRSRTVAQGSH